MRATRYRWRINVAVAMRTHFDDYAPALHHAVFRKAKYNKICSKIYYFALQNMVHGDSIKATVRNARPAERNLHE